jgi:hypothetical protein
MQPIILIEQSNPADRINKTSIGRYQTLALASRRDSGRAPLTNQKYSFLQLTKID